MFGAGFAALYFFWLKVFSVLAPIALTVVHGLWVALGLLPCIWMSRSRRPWTAFAAVPFFWTAAEWLRSLGPYGYEWGSIGYTQYGSLRMAAFSAIGGIWLVSFLVLVSNALLAWACYKKNWRVLALTCLYGSTLWILSPASRLSADIGPARDFVLVQTNVSPYPPTSEREEIMKVQLDLLSKQASPARATNLVLPETLFSTEIAGMQGHMTDDPRGLLMDFLRPSPSRLLLVGAIERDEKGFYNSAILFDGSGRRLDSYRKRHLVPFGETIPRLEKYAWARELGEKLQTPFFSAGDTHAPIYFGDVPACVLICFEGTFSRLVSESAVSARIIINISNDAWSESEFGHEQHARFLRFRAIETGLPVIRVGNSGITCLFAPNGALTAIVPHPGPDVMELARFVDGR